MRAVFEDLRFATGADQLDPSSAETLKRLAAAIVVALLAVVTEVSLGALQRGVTPRGLKLERKEATT